MSEKPSPPSRRTCAWIITGFFATAFAVFGSSLTHEFVLWDDTYLIFSNPIIKEMSLQTLKAAFSTYDPELYIPLTIVSYQIDHLIGGLQPWIFHLTNLILHTANALLVAWLVYVLLKACHPEPVEGRHAATNVMVRQAHHDTFVAKNYGWVALLSGLIFLLHPLQTEAVAWASARKDLLSTFFFLLSFIGFLIYRDRGGRRIYYASLACFALALLAKVSIVTLPVLLVLVLWRDHSRWTRERVLELVPFFLLAVVFGVIAVFGKRDVVSSVTPLHQILVAGKSTTFYLQKFFLPSGLGALYPYGDALKGIPPDLAFHTLLGTLLFIVALIFGRRRRDVSFAILFYLLTLAPSFTNIFKGKEIYFASDRYAYIPLIGILLFVVPRTERLLANRFKPVAVCIVAIFAILSFRQTQVWRDSFTLFEQTLRHYPRAVAAHINLSVAHRHIGDLETAARHLDEAESIKDNMHIHTSRAAIFMKQNKFAEAIEENRKAAALDPRDPSPLYGTALAYRALGNLTEAEQAYLRTLALEPRHLGAHNNLAAIELERGDRAKAADLYRKALEIDNTFSVAHFNLGIIAEEEGDMVEAIRRFEKTVELEPNAAIDALEHLLDLYAQRNDLERSVGTAERILRIKPDHPTAGKFLEALRERGML